MVECWICFMSIPWEGGPALRKVASDATYEKLFLEAPWFARNIVIWAEAAAGEHRKNNVFIMFDYVHYYDFTMFLLCCVPALPHPHPESDWGIFGAVGNFCQAPSSPGIPPSRQPHPCPRRRRGGRGGAPLCTARGGGSAKEIGVRGSAKNHNKSVCKRSH